MPATYNLGSFTQETQKQCLVNPFQIHSASTQTTIFNLAGRRLLTYTGGVLAMTLSAPVAGTDDGLCIKVTNATTQAHTVTCTGKLNDGAGHNNTLTFSANLGGSFEIVAYNGAWYVQTLNGVTGS